MVNRERKEGKRKEIEVMLIHLIHPEALKGSAKGRIVAGYRWCWLDLLPLMTLTSNFILNHFQKNSGEKKNPFMLRRQKTGIDNA